MLWIYYDSTYSTFRFAVFGDCSQFLWETFGSMKFALTGLYLSYFETYNIIFFMLYTSICYFVMPISYQLKKNVDLTEIIFCSNF